MTTKHVFFNGRIFVRSERKAATASFCNTMVIEGDKIVFLGDADHSSVQSAKTQGAEAVDLQNRVVVPGFIDGHAHMLLFGSSLKKLDLTACTTLNEIRSTISRYAKLHPDLPRLNCRGWHQPATEGLALASMLDDLDPRPIYVEALDLHSTWCSSAALQELPIDEMKRVCGDFVTCDADGQPTGLVAELAQTGYVLPSLMQMMTVEEKLTALEEGFQAYISAGYTGAIDMLMDSDSWEALRLYREHKGSLPIHIAAHWFIPEGGNQEELSRLVDGAIAMHHQWHPSKTPDFCVVGIKLIADGVVDGCTAALSQKYPRGPEIVNPIWPSDDMNFVVKRAASAGLQCAIHAIGDVAIKQAVDAIAASKSPNGRHRIEHLELATEEDAKRLGELGITASVQPVHSDPHLVKAYRDLIGPDLWKRAFAYRDFLEGDAHVALGTDAPTAKHLALLNLYNATTRRSATDPTLTTQTHAHQALTLSQAVHAASTGAAYSRRAELWTGSLTEGLQADFVVLDMSWTPETLLESRVFQTWSAGKKIFQDGDR